MVCGHIFFIKFGLNILSLLLLIDIFFEFFYPLPVMAANLIFSSFYERPSSIHRHHYVCKSSTLKISFTTRPAGGQLVYIGTDGNVAKIREVAHSGLLNVRIKGNERKTKIDGRPLQQLHEQH